MFQLLRGGPDRPEVSFMSTGFPSRGSTGSGPTPQREERSAEMLLSDALNAFEREIRTTGQTLPLCPDDGVVTLFRPLHTVYVGIQLAPGWNIQAVELELLGHSTAGAPRLYALAASSAPDRMPRNYAAALGTWFRWERQTPSSDSCLRVSYWRDVVSNPQAGQGDGLKLAG